MFAEITANGVKKITAMKDTVLRVEEKTDLWGMPALRLNVTGVGGDEVYFVENEWDYHDGQEYDEAKYTQPVGSYVRMRRLLPGDQVLMSVDSTVFGALAVGSTVNPTAGGTVGTSN